MYVERKTEIEKTYLYKERKEKLPKRERERERERERKINNRWRNRDSEKALK